MFKTVRDPRPGGPIPLIADGQVRLRAPQGSANDLDDSRPDVPTTRERPFASVFVAWAKPAWQPSDTTHVSVEELHATYLPPLLEVET
jgi:hypothetical protein